MKKKAVLFWSGGKDSAYALYTIKNQHPGVKIVRLITTLNFEFKRISMHGVSEALLEKQALAIGLPLQKMWVSSEPTNQSYEIELDKLLASLKDEGIDHIIFGDIFLEDLKVYRDKILSGHQLTGIYPLWKKDTSQLIRHFIDLNFKTITCCVSTKYLSEAYVGKEIDQAFISSLPLNVDPCGENGEFHTFCFAGPIFKSVVEFTKGEKQFRPLIIRENDKTEQTGFWYIDLISK